MVRKAKMVEKMETSHWWWFDSHKKSKLSPWLQSTLQDLDSKTNSMLKLIEADADSFAQRAEMYYKKRPELISMVEDFYRTHRSLAERYDQVKSESGTRLLSTLGSPFSTPRKSQQEKNLDLMHNIVLDSCSSENYDTEEEDAESEVEDPEELEDIDISLEQNPVQNLTMVEEDEEEKEDITSACEQVPGKDDEVEKLREEIEKLRQESESQKVLLVQKDEEKREVIRQLSLSIHILKDENLFLKKSLLSQASRGWNPFEASRFKGGFLGKLFNGAPRSSTTFVAL